MVKIGINLEYGRTHEFSRDQFLAFLKTHNIIPSKLTKKYVLVTNNDHAMFVMKYLDREYKEMFLEDLEAMLYADLAKTLREEIDKDIIKMIKEMNNDE